MVVAAVLAEEDRGDLGADTADEAVRDKDTWTSRSVGRRGALGRRGTRGTRKRGVSSD